MISKEIKISVTEYSSPEETGPETASLIQLAAHATTQAYAPYSGFNVGVAIELSDGTRFIANNQENKAYPSGLCAERTGLFYVKANHPDSTIQRMIILAQQNGVLTEEPAYPCGACRQVMVETEERQNLPIEIFMVGRNRIVRVESAGSLLPLKFIL
jgi:cytidine deaminase